MSVVRTPIAGFTDHEQAAALDYAEQQLTERLDVEVLDRAGDAEHPVIVLWDRDRLRFGDVRLARVEFRPRLGVYDDAIRLRLRRALTAWVNTHYRDDLLAVVDLQIRLDAIGVYLDAGGSPHVLDYVPNAYS